MYAIRTDKWIMMVGPDAQVKSTGFSYFKGRSDIPLLLTKWAGNGYSYIPKVD